MLHQERYRTCKPPSKSQTMAEDRLTYNYTAVGMIPYGHLWRVLRRLVVVESVSSNSLQWSSGMREEEIQMVIRSLYREVSKNLELLDFCFYTQCYHEIARWKMSY
ncbi:hypothetical protein ACH5RR_027125 [Cinchona calisaya]|uniref:Uncharacterized protein n=1 Tax=Cinchona calisaya TaxID=153742 RepID=A0ABD2Z4K3_9GENT